MERGHRVQGNGRGFQDRYGLPPRGDEGNRENLLQVGVPLLEVALSDTKLKYTLAGGTTGDVVAKIGIIDGHEFLELFENFTWHEQYAEVVAPFKRFLEKATDDGRIKEWVIVWPQPTKTVPKVSVAGLTDLPIITRNRRKDRIDFVGSDRKHSDAALPIAKGGSVAGLPGAEGRGVVLIYLADDRENQSLELSDDNVVPLLSIAAPRSATPHRRDLIQWTVRVKSQEDAATVEVEA